MMLGAELIVCKLHRTNNGTDGPLSPHFGGQCPSCRIAIDWNIWRQRCHCGAPAIGYRAKAADAVVEFFCDDHFADADTAQGVSGEGA